MIFYCGKVKCNMLNHQIRTRCASVNMRCISAHHVEAGPKSDERVLRMQTTQHAIASSNLGKVLEAHSTAEQQQQQSEPEIFHHPP
jgi:hypothetical protein